MQKNNNNQKHYVLKMYDGSTLIILRSSVATFLDLKMIVQEHTSLQIENQKYAIHNRRLKFNDDQLLSKLRMSNDDRLMVYTKQKKKHIDLPKDQQEAKVINKPSPEIASPKKQDQVQYIEDSSLSQQAQHFKIKDLESFRHKANTQQVIMIPSSSAIQQFGYFLWKNGIPEVTSVLLNQQLQNRLVQSFIKLNIFKKYRSSFLGNTQFLKFVCKKLAQINSNLKQLPNCIKKIEIELYQLQPTLTQKQRNEVIAKISQSVDLQLVKQLQKLGYKQEVAQHIIELSQNNILKAIEYLTINKKLFDIDLKIPTQKLDQCKFLYFWYMKPEHNILRLKFASSQTYLDSYTLAMKHRSPQFYNVLVNERKYVLKLIKETKIDLYHNSQ